MALEEYNRLGEEIKHLKPFKFTMGKGVTVMVEFSVSRTLFDGKNVNAIVGNKATQRCPMCLITSHNFNNQNVFIPKEGSLSHGLGLLHCKIKIFDHLLHIAYKQEVKVWDVTKNIKESVDLYAGQVRDRLYNAFKIRVDQVIQGKGTSNNGNLARKFLDRPKDFANALDIDEELVCNLATITKVYRSALEIEVEELKKFSDFTYKLHYIKYPWARMNPSMHKILQHGPDIVRQFPMPVAFYAEDALESMHKIHRETIREHSRRNSRENAILDTFNRAVYLSDPILSMVYLDRRREMHKKRPLTNDITRFLKPGQWTDPEDRSNED
ncbi:uncharacterized protein LOC118757377 [Rhagoletis pomonella]|uniref:uncharacterized protein LOC118757377 n=1 Tax=Rhagoletis pomonella TaxID=28610 RepID=UPI0017806E8F|nr:uncharacterized protein LOC118757377 [Rhagoletis pomonella]